MRRVPTGALALILAAAALGALPAQSTIYVPDINPQVPGGTATNTIPFGSASYTYMGKIPASAMDPLNTRVNDVAFAPGNSGTWNAATVRFAIGHLPSPLPCPFTFPGPGAATIGSFLDLTVVYDSALQGPLNWTWTAAQWSPLGLAALGGTSFVWNGIDDVGIYLTFTGATTTSGFHRNPNGPPLRTYATGFEAATSTACDALFGLVTSLQLVPNQNALSVASSGPGVNDLIFSLTNISPTATEGWILPSITPAQPLGSGVLFGINPDAVTWLILLGTPIADGNVFHFPVPSTLGLFPNVPAVFPPGSTAALTGVTADFVAVMLRPGFVYDGQSPVARITF